MRRALPLLFLIACGPEAAPPPAKPVVSPPASVASATPTTKEAAPPRADSSLLARSVLFSNPDRANPQLSPDGKQLSYLSNLDGVLNVWIGLPIGLPGSTPPPKAITHDKKRGIRQYKWSRDGSHILYLQDEGGDENWHVHAVDPKTQTDRDLTPIPGARAQLEMLSWKKPGEVLVGLNDRDKRYFDLWKIEIATGKKTLVMKNEGYSSFVTDDDYVVRFATKPDKDGSTEVLAYDGKAFTPFARIPHEDALTTDLMGLDAAGKKLFMKDSRGRDKAALVELDIASKKTKVLAEDAQADVVDALQHPTDHHVQAALSVYDHQRWHVVDPKVQPDFDALQKVLKDDFQITSRTKDDALWLVTVMPTDAAVKYYVYDRGTKKAEFLFTSQRSLDQAELRPMKPAIIKSRDGLDLVSYLTLPKDANGPVPMVLFVHGGPWARDELGFNRTHQWLASRGYAVLSVNYRGSTGFGKAFVNAADKEWAGKMHDDLIDAVQFMVKKKVADEKKVAIMGGSYGGYATLVGLTFTPDTFACGVDIVGPSNLATLLNSIPPYWEVEVEQFTKRIGDHRTEEGKAFLASRSPLTRADKITKPLLIGQGANDPRVKQAEADQIVAKMKDKGIPVTYVLYPDEGHGFVRPENRTSFNAVAEVFLAQCLGGPYQPFGKDFEGSSITVPAGAKNVFGLEAALPKH